MVPEIGNKKFNNSYSAKEPKEGDRLICFFEKEIVCNMYEGGFEYPKAIDYDKESLLYLFSIDDISYFLWYGTEAIALNGFEKMPFKEIRTRGSNEDYLVVFTAWHLYVWYQDNRYCGRCGKPTKIGTKERNLICECGNTIFPKIMPAVIVGVRNGDKLLMTRYAHREYKGWALIAGFCEIGETAEETVKREVLEEVGIHVENVTYYASQPWGIDQDLLLGYYCDAIGNENIHIDEMELATGEWVNRSDMPVREDLQSLTATMMEAFRRGIDKERYYSRHTP